MKQLNFFYLFLLTPLTLPSAFQTAVKLYWGRNFFFLLQIDVDFNRGT